MNKKLFLISLLSVFFMGATAQPGVNFENLTFAEAKARALELKKPLFVDCYTEWCVPCKAMAEKVFPQKESGDFFNANFVNVKYDMEKGEGVDIAKTYNVKSFPTFLIISPEGELIYTVTGGGATPADFIARVKPAMSEKTTFPYLDQLYKSGKMGKEQLLDYWIALTNGNSRDNEYNGKILAELESQLSVKDKTSKRYWPLFENKALLSSSADFQFIVENRKALRKNVGRETVDDMIYNVFLSSFGPFLFNGNVRILGDVNLVGSQVDGLDIDQAKKEILQIMVRFSKAKIDGDNEQYIDILADNYSKLPANSIYYVMNGIRSVERSGTKEQVARIAGLSGEILDSVDDLEVKPILEGVFAPYKRMAHKGVYWVEANTLQDALDMAYREGKLVFVDCYTDWCGPCKYMADNIFPQEKVGDYFNQKFINVKFNAEKGEGLWVAQKYQISAYPTFLILNSSGALMHRLVGGSDGDAMILRAEEAFDPNKSIGLMTVRYHDGDRTPEFIKNYIAVLVAQRDAHAMIVWNDFFDSMTDEQRTLPEFWPIFFDSQVTPVNSAPHKYMIENLDKFIANVGKENVLARLENDYMGMLSAIMMGADNTSSAADVDKWAAEIKSYGLASAAELVAYANGCKLILAGETDAAPYKKASGALALERIPFPTYFSRVKDKLSDTQFEEWRAWGEELAGKTDDPNLKNFFLGAFAK